MKILNAEQLKYLDATSIENYSIPSIDLMERASEKVFNFLKSNYNLANQSFTIICGQGNNGGDGLAIARMLFNYGNNPDVYLLNLNDNYSQDNLINQKRLRELGVKINIINDLDDIRLIENQVLIDALFGYGLNRSLDYSYQGLIDKINQFNDIISIDMPSGLQCEEVANESSIIVKATHTLSFQVPKLAFFFSENEKFIGKWQILNIGLENEILSDIQTEFSFITQNLVRSCYKHRKAFSHKGTYGHSLIIGGSYGKIGAVALSSQSCLKSGAGLVTSYIPKCGYEIMQISNPEIMTITDINHSEITHFPEVKDFNAVGIGMGLGTDKKTEKGFIEFITNYPPEMPLVIDADALNLLSTNKNLLKILPEHAILTPHPKEFERLAGKSINSKDRLLKGLGFSRKFQIILVLKGAYTQVITPAGQVYFNSTGNPGMATAGSGDVLTGIITGLLSQNYSPEEATISGVYLHGLSGDLALKQESLESLTAMSLIKNLGNAFKKVYT